MPTSDGQGKDVALGWYRKIAPTTVVDVGAGAGTYATLMRQHHEAHWTAVEVFPAYVDEFGLNQLYDDVIVQDVRRLNWLTFRTDLVIAGDVLEHMTHADAKAVLRRMKQGAANIIISIPVLHLPQGAVNGNEYERHVDHWTAGMMGGELGDGVIDSWVGSVLGYFWWQRAHVETRPDQ